jgi:hypothetical protein
MSFTTVSQLGLVLIGTELGLDETRLLSLPDDIISDVSFFS